MTDTVVSKATLLRVISDLKEIKKNPLDSEGIYYEHDEVNMLRGYALIIPQNNTPYQYGNYLFIIDFPTNYPYSPPKVTYMTNNGATRFHPNLYRNGKVCLSLLNTWKGDQWTSCNTLTSVLVNIQSIFTEDPFLHEPGIKKTHPDFNNYNRIIEYQNFQTAIYKMIFDDEYKKKISSIEPHFSEIIRENYEKNRNAIQSKLLSLKNDGPTFLLEMDFYKMNDVIDYSSLYRKLKMD